MDAASTELEPWKWLVARRDRKRTQVVVEARTRFEALALGARQMRCVIETAYGEEPVLGQVDARVLTEAELAKLEKAAAA
jgi:hypothetical protein